MGVSGTDRRIRRLSVTHRRQEVDSLANRQASFAKRQKEIARKAHQQKKAEKKELRKSAVVPRAEGDEDPDIAGIRPGPQPIPEDDF